MRRTEVTCITWVIQQTSGSAMIGWAIYAMEQGGIAASTAYSLGVALPALGFVGTVLSWFLMPHFGRRDIYIWGQVGMFVTLMIVGGLGVPEPTIGYSYASGALLLILTFIYDLTVGPICYSLVAELPSTRLRIKTVVLSRNVYNICGIIIGVLQPQFLNPLGLNWRGKTCFFWAGTCLLGLAWTYFRLPEPKGLTYGKPSSSCLIFDRVLTSLQLNLTSFSRTEFPPESSVRSSLTHGDPTTLSSYQRSRRPPSARRSTSVEHRADSLAKRIASQYHEVGYSEMLRLDDGRRVLRFDIPHTLCCSIRII